MRRRILYLLSAFLLLTLWDVRYPGAAVSTQGGLSENAEPQPREELSASVEPQPREEFSASVEPQPREEFSASVEPQSQEELSDNVEPQSREELSDNAEPQSREELSDNAEPQSREELSDNAEPQSQEELSESAEPQSQEELSESVEPQPREELSDNVEPQSQEELPLQGELSETPSLPLTGRLICIDPGHGVTPLIREGLTAPVSPLSDARKPLYVSGTEGKGMTEEKLNLIVGLKLRDALTELGADVIMTREVSEIAVSNVERSEIANEAGADVNIHIHADGVDNPNVHGVSVLIPGGDLLGTPSIAEESARLGELMVNAVAESTGAKNRGTVPRDDMTGFNFSEVPTVLIEMGFMTNPEEDALLETDEYQNLIVEGIARSLLQWYGAET